MAAAGALPEICEDPNFKKLADSKTDAEEFSSLVNSRLLGYTQRKTVQDGIKELITRVEAIDQKLVVAKAIGKKAGELDETQDYLHKHYTLASLKEKSAFLTTSMNATLDAGELTAEELEPTLQSLKMRLQKAKVDGKEKLFEKLERQIGVVSAAKPVSVPIAEIKDIFNLQQQLDEVQQLLLKPRKDLSAEEREKVKSSHKVRLELDIEAAKARCQMWFETAEDFKRRLSKALEWYNAHLEIPGRDRRRPVRARRERHHDRPPRRGPGRAVVRLAEWAQAPEVAAPDQRGQHAEAGHVAAPGHGEPGGGGSPTLRRARQLQLPLAMAPAAGRARGWGGGGAAAAGVRRPAAACERRGLRRS